ncbi:MAG: hypothetical protein A2147_09770 [Chloroflexi bacterium RBG_16_57_8]|nr:MAG: hypothetical protein A2147_09770 [Chloroflexi bacterium RBG_16_57_8]
MKKMSDFFKALLFAGIPFVTLFIIVLAMVGRGAEFVWMLGLALCVLALLTSGGFAIAEKRRIALGILAGTAIGFVGLVISCSTVLASPP